MSRLPQIVDELLQRALVSEVAVVGKGGRPVVHPLLPLWDGEKIYITSSVLFSRKLRHIKSDPRVSVAITDPVACGGMSARCVIQGDARIFEEDPHETWERIRPLWRAKEPGIDAFVKARYALPLFFERSLIEITPRRVLWWEDGDPARPPQTLDLAEVA
jgi:nitroimidazol reductase NimA-like FMN-containing flavoprotein (pyridoxamine 5'-phosphate oxidase superfamily)